MTTDWNAAIELEASERRFRARFDQADMPQAMVDLEGRLLLVNEALCRLFDRDRDQIEGRLSRDFRHPTDPGCEEGLEAIASGRHDSRTWERIVTRPDGTAITLIIQASLLRDADGTPSGISCFMQDVSSLHQARRALAGRDAFFAALVLHSSDFFLLTDVNGKPLYVSESMRAAAGHDAESRTGRLGWAVLHSDDVAHVRRTFDDVVGVPASSQTVLFRTDDGDGRWRWIEQVLTNCLDDPDIAGVVCNGRDVTARVETEQALQASEARYRAIADTAQEGILTARPDGQVLYANHKIADILGLPPGTVYATKVQDLFTPGNETFLTDKLKHRHERGHEKYELTYPHPDGRERVLRFSVTPLPTDAGTSGSLAMITDITDERRTEVDLRRAALHDGLTGLANRSLLTDRLNQALARSHRAGGTPVAVLFADLDQFKLINDSWGHAAGDLLLVAVAERLSAAIRAGDTVARFGGDEFVIICEGANETDAEELAAQLLQVLAEPFEVAGQRAYISASIGITVSPPNSGEELLRFADAAMYDAKARGRGRAQMFDVALADEANARFALGNDLRDALANEDLTLHYQPLVDLGTGRVIGVEALARWKHPTRGNVPPAQFVAVAEASGLAPTLDRWALQRACRDLARLRETDPTLRVSVNLSARHLADASLEQTVLTALENAGLHGSALQLEITESAMMDNPTEARALLERLQARGISIAIDDFGTGYSSLGYLSQLPATALKIDRSFIQNITEDPDSLAIVASIIDLARAVRITTIAEGVETIEQLTLLHRLGCAAGQGFLWTRALPLDELLDKLDQLPNGHFDNARMNTRNDHSVRSRKHKPATAEHGLRRMTSLHREGASLATIASALNNDGYRTPKGLRWHRNTVAQVISDVAYPNLWQATGATASGR